MSQLMSKGLNSLLTGQLLDARMHNDSAPVRGIGVTSARVRDSPVPRLAGWSFFGRHVRDRGTDSPSAISFCGQSPASACQPKASLIPAALGPVLAGDGEGGPDTSGLRCWAGGQQHKWLCTRCLATGSTDKLAKVAVHEATQRKQQHWSV
ncbi:hypothetical protein CKAH01_00879 [Colletotrichum kahawae]|uniref:Uncharacterized protein n=1 Tax=Colletotrichum kahawae TaxID=34407 RepID=A0AAD9YK63_COLKA|nr:hypothetical protein CKAH01_00879 [Colletotrichum kahawae]